MKIAPVICFAVAAAVAGSMLPATSSYALTYPTKAQNCAFTGSSTEGVGNCRPNKEDSARQERPASVEHSVSFGHAASRVRG